MIETYLLMLAQLQTKGIARGYLYFMKNFAEQIQSVFMDLSKDCTQDTFIKQRISLQQKLKFLWMGAYNNSVGFEQIETNLDLQIQLVQTLLVKNHLLGTDHYLAKILKKVSNQPRAPQLPSAKFLHNTILESHKLLKARDYQIGDTIKLMTELTFPPSGCLRTSEFQCSKKE
jgi:hypothetical protein